MRLKAVIFDMDGVIVDNRDAHLEAFGMFAGRYGIEPDPRRLVTFFGMTNEGIMEEVFGRKLPPEQIRRFSDEKEAIYREIYDPAIEPARGLVELLKTLKMNDIKVAVGSSAPRENVDFVLERCGITECFDQIASGREITHSKPDPEVYLLAAKKLQVSPAECVVFEDSFVGMEAGRRAGMKVVAMATTFPKDLLKERGDYDLLIDHFEQIGLKDLERLLRAELKPSKLQL